MRNVLNRIFDVIPKFLLSKRKTAEFINEMSILK